MIGSAILKPSIQPGCGRTSADSMMLGRTIEAGRILEPAEQILAFSGGGLSTASGIPDYRDHRGEWKRRPPVMIQAFRAANDVLLGAVQGIADLIVRPGLINVDFADVRTVMSEMGMAMMGTGHARGDDRAQAAAEAAIQNPLLDDINLPGQAYSHVLRAPLGDGADGPGNPLKVELRHCVPPLPPGERVRTTAVARSEHRHLHDQATCLRATATLAM